MKVYELMKMLSKEPAGNEVVVGGFLTMEEIKKSEKTNQNEYLSNGIAEYVDDDNTTTYIHFLR